MLIIYDTETTGLVKHPSAPLAKQPRIIEFGAVKLSMKTGKVVGRLSQLINPGEKLDAEITKITSITNDDLADKLDFTHYWKGVILPFLKGATLMLAHNEPFDHALLDYELKRANLKPFAWPQIYCTISLYRERWGHDMKLTELYESLMGKPLDQKHRAGSDVDALVEIVQKEKLWKVLA